MENIFKKTKKKCFVKIQNKIRRENKELKQEMENIHRFQTEHNHSSNDDSYVFFFLFFVFFFLLGCLARYTEHMCGARVCLCV